MIFISWRSILKLVITSQLFLKVSAQNYQLTSSCGGSVEAGGSCTLICYTGEASHTVIQWQNGTLSNTVRQGSCNSTSPSLPADYTTSCPSSTNYTLTINNAMYSRDRVSWTCDYQYGYHESNKIQMDVQVPLSTVALTRTTASVVCVAVSNPPPSMTLYRDGTSVATSPAAVDGDNGCTATINYQLTGTRRNSLYYCQASNTQSTVNSMSSYPDIAVSRVTLTTITSANEEVGAAEGQPLTLTCVTSIIYPAATVTWYKNSVEVTEGTSTTNAITSGVVVQTTSTVTFNSVVRSDLGHTVYCRATNIHTSSPVQSDSARLGVWFGPEQLDVTNPDNSVAVENRNLTLTCTVKAHPSPTFTWDYSDGTLVVGGSTRPVTGSSTLWLQTLTFRPNKDKTNVTCHVRNTRTSVTQIGSISLDVKYPPPGPPSFTQFPAVMFEGDSQTIRCSVTGGNPLAMITWSCPGAGSSSVSSSGQTNTSILTFTVSKSRNGQQCQCQGAWQYGGYNLSDVRTFNVSYPPSKPSIIVPPVLCEGRPASSLYCSSSDRGNPAATYTWTKNSLPVSPDFSPARTDNRATMRCSAGNIFTNRTANTAPVSDAWQLNVYYSPKVSIKSTPSVTRKEGDSLSLTCLSDSNPSTSDSDIKWVFGDVETGGPGLQKSNLSRYDDGMYTCRTAVNAGICGTLQGHKDITVTVNYAPDITMREAELTEGQTLSLLCHAEGRPTIYTFTRFTQYWGDTEIESHDGQQDRGNYTLTIDSATYLDAGMYECGVDNTVTDRNNVLVQRKKVSVSVRAHPKFIEDSKQIFGAEVGTNTTLVQSFYNSEVNYTSYNWTFGPLGTLVNRSGSVRSRKVTLRKNNKEVQLAGFSVSLDIQNFQTQDIGVYTATVCNVVGCNSSEVNLTAAGPPFVPLEFMVVNATLTCVLLRWKSNYPGGDYTQIFLVYYRVEKSGEWKTREYKDNPGGYVYADIMGLQPGTRYEFKVKARNSREQNNEGHFTQVESKVTQTTHNKESYTGIAAGAGVGGAVLLLAVIGGTVLFMRKRLQHGADTEKHLMTSSGFEKKGSNENEFVSMENDIYHSGNGSSKHEKEEAVMQENDIYQGGAALAAEGVVYSQVAKPKKPVKKDDEAVHARPSKEKKTKKEKEKNLVNQKGFNSKMVFLKDAEKKKNKMKKDDEIKLKPKKQQSRGDVYENTVPGQFGDGTYANAGFVGDDAEAGPSEKTSGECQKSGQKSGRDEDGLLYVSVDFGNATPSTEIHRSEESTEYAGIAFGQVGALPPPDEEEKK